MRTLFTIGLGIPGRGADFVPFDSDRALLDADIVVFRPGISTMLGYDHTTYQGRPCLSDDASFRLKERLNHWRRELTAALSSGKTIIVFLSEPEEVFVASGDKQYSGTGRNVRTTRIVAPSRSFDCLPGALSFTACTGQAMRLADKANILSEYWRLFGERSQYRVVLDSKVSEKLVVSKDAARTLGALIRWKDIPGTLLLLPDVHFEDKEFTTKSGAHWTNKALAVGNQFLNCLVEIDRAIRATSEVTPTPEWATLRSFDLPKERDLKAELLKKEDAIRAMMNDKASLQQRIREEAVLKNLLYEKGKPLEHAIVKALTLLGFKSEPYREGDSEFDVVFESEEGRFIGEAEGKDNKAISIDKLRQLGMNIHEDFEREGITTMGKGVLFGNAYRLSPLPERGSFFTDKCLLAAQRGGCALVRTPDLFVVVRHLSGSQDVEFAKRCREAIVNATGTVVQFPSVPEEAKEEVSKTDDTTQESTVS